MSLSYSIVNRLKQKYLKIPASVFALWIFFASATWCTAQHIDRIYTVQLCEGYSECHGNHPVLMIFNRCILFLSLLPSAGTRLYQLSNIATLTSDLGLELHWAGNGRRSLIACHCRMLDMYLLGLRHEMRRQQCNKEAVCTFLSETVTSHRSACDSCHYYVAICVFFLPSKQDAIY